MLKSLNLPVHPNSRISRFSEEIYESRTKIKFLLRILLLLGINSKNIEFYQWRLAFYINEHAEHKRKTRQFVTL